MSTYLLLLKISRPRFWVYLAGPYLFGYTLAYDHRTTFLTIEFIYTLLFFLLPANIFIYSVNDIFDKQTDELNPKKNNKEEKIQNKNSTIYKYAVFISLATALPIFFYQSTLSNILFLLFLFISIAYSAPPLRFKIRPVVDSASNILYAIPGFIGFAQLQNSLPSIEIMIIALCWTAAMHLYSAIPDIEYDKKAGMNTTAVYLGYKKSLITCFVLWLIMAVLSMQYGTVFYVAFIYPLCALAVITNYIMLDNMYWKFPYINTALGFLLYVYAYNS